jgi:hypothetical protein
MSGAISAFECEYNYHILKNALQNLHKSVATEKTAMNSFQQLLYNPAARRRWDPLAVPRRVI